MARIKVAITKSLEKVYTVHQGMTVGRDPKNQIQLLAQPVSRNHAQFIVDGEAVRLLDLGSSNGTKVNGERISEVTLNEGDVIDIGGILMTFAKEAIHVAEKNIFSIDDENMPEDKMRELADRSEVGLVFGTTPGLIDLAYNIGRIFLDRIGLPEDDNVNVLTALYEAMDNAKRHGNANDPLKSIRLYFMDLPDRITVNVEDDGEGFDYATILQNTEEQDALSAARERYMAGGMGGLGIRLMLKCVDKIEYEQEGSKILLTKFKQPLAPEETEEKELTQEEQVYKTTLWDEIESVKERLPERKGKLAERLAEAEVEASLEPPEPEEGTSTGRPEERIKRFEDRLSQFFFRDSRDGLKAVAPEDLDKEAGEEAQEGQNQEDTSDEFKINMPEHIQRDESLAPDGENPDS
jgi:anti-sigma regulatory factor (Ser/Thr protein kinase)